MQAEDIPQQLAVKLTISEVNKQYLLIDSSLQLPPKMLPLLVHQTYFFFVIELRTGIKNEDLPKISNYFLGICDDILGQDLKGISFVINGEQYIVEDKSMAAIKELFEKTFVISKQDDYSKTLVKTRHAVQSAAQKLKQSRITLLFFFSHIAIDHSLGVKKRSYIDHLNEHSDLCTDQVAHLAKNVKRFTDECRTYIISYDKEGEQQTDYSLCDTDLMNQINMRVGTRGSTISRNYSYNQLSEAFQSTSALMLFKMYSLSLLLPVHENKKTYATFYEKIDMECQKYKDINGGPIYIKKELLDNKKLKDQGITILKDIFVKDENQFQKELDTVKVRTEIDYQELQSWKTLFCRAQVGSIEINEICTIIQKEIVSYKRVYYGGKSELIMEFNKDLFLDMRDRLEIQYQESKNIFETIRGEKHPGNIQMLLYDAYNQFKGKIDRTRQILVRILKKQIGGSQIGQLSQVINLNSIKASLKNKLMRRINANPFLLDQVYSKIEDIVDHGGIDFPQLEVDTSTTRKALGNCIVSDKNLVKAMSQYDALGVAFQIEGPMAAIADPGRIRIRQVSPSLMSVSTFFEKFLYKIEYSPNIVKLIFEKCGRCKSKYCNYFGNCDFINKHLSAVQVSYNGRLRKNHGIDHWNQNASKNDFRTDQINLQDTLEGKKVELDYLRQTGDLEKYNYKENWDYTNKVQSTPTALGFMPLFLAKEHWKVAKQLMKPCLAFTATGEPLAYMFAQYQNIPFMMLSSVIRTCKELEYQLEEQLKTVNTCQTQQELHLLETAINLRKMRIERMKHIRDAIDITCRNIMQELSQQHFDPPLVKLVEQRYKQYKQPICRTVDVIANNSAFLGQLFTAFQGKFLEKPKEEEFHWFFVRLIEEELRRETDGWNQEQTQDAFVDKLLNLDAEKIKNKQNQIVIVNKQNYAQRFYSAIEGFRTQGEQIRVRKEDLQLVLKKDGKFNDNQRMLIIEYKRMYVNRVLWMWYVRFLLYGQKDRQYIHKWKCLGLINSIMLFCLIIQNKKQRKNYKRREAIAQGDYADPFNYQAAWEHLYVQFSTLYDKIISGMCKKVQFLKAKGAAEVFALTQSLEEAAGVLLDSHGLIPDINQALLHNNVPLFVQKMEMLVHGTYRGVHFAKWIPGKKRERKLRHIYRIEYQKYQCRM